jgi:hypothetical protein
MQKQNSVISSPDSGIPFEMYNSMDYAPDLFGDKEGL